MANGIQLKNAIDAATSRLMEQGTASADLKDIMLAGFGYLAERMDSRTVILKLDSKKAFAAGAALGGGIAAGIATVLRQYLA